MGTLGDCVSSMGTNVGWVKRKDNLFFGHTCRHEFLGNAVIEGKAKIIEGDLATGNFDKTLDKYKPQSRKLSQVKVTEVFKQFATHRGKSIFESSQVKYKALARSLHYGMDSIQRAPLLRIKYLC
jgi:hypothetical protein